MSTSKRTLVLSAFCTADSDDGPEFAVINDAHHLLVEVKRLEKLCTENNLSEARVYFGPDWGPGDVEDELRLQCGELVVCPTSFWFSDYPKYADYKIESTNVDIPSLESALAEEGSGCIFMGDNTDDMKERYTEDLVSKFDAYDESDKVSDHYDSDAEFASLLRDNLPGFEYPDYSGMTVAQVVDRIISFI
ncbi:hypothetical protein [Pseudomonas aeruginosa]|uniref:hypothetical protein n=1 Tax=Pseudomonas aeruginosa TaxID=287 RepID=UPI001ADC9731|nr:hypothetical protein [Pseudomonas aeruginosa]MBO8337259.1 hypothetical protein [Pseudomonas aeruginosa]HCF4079464.1 hypothetical protein [Pseudomonas aeruginosa]